MDCATKPTTTLYLFVFLLLCHWTSGVPRGYHLVTNRIRPTAEDESLFSHLATRALETIVHIVSFVSQSVIRLPSWFSSHKPIFRFTEPSNPTRSKDWSLEDFE